jgi:hypothetical protein
VTGRLLAELMTGESPAVDAAPYRHRAVVSAVLRPMAPAFGRPWCRPTQNCRKLDAGNFGAGEGARTLDPDLGKVVLYH